MIMITMTMMSQHKRKNITIAVALLFRCFAAVLLCSFEKVAALLLTHRQHTVSFPLQRTSKEMDKSIIRKSFKDMIQKSDYFEPCTLTTTSSNKINAVGCIVPQLGNAKITLESSLKTQNEYTITMETETKQDCILVCTQLVQELNSFSLQFYPIRNYIANYYNSLPPHPGYNADDTANYELMDSIFTHKHVKTLQEDGFVILKLNPKPLPDQDQHLKLVQLQKTAQSKSIRSDSVAFLTRKDAQESNIEYQFDLLMSITSYLNKYLKFDSSSKKALKPGTKRKPLTNPNVIQIASYGTNEFYTPHCDCTIFENGSRSNYRCYTYIYYCNDDWNLQQDGGALRVYYSSKKERYGKGYVDINPIHGTLVIFDSTMLHSVEPVVANNKQRIALTLWALEPIQDVKIQGETYDAGTTDY